jgi:hypothetical protein
MSGMNCKYVVYEGIEMILFIIEMNKEIEERGGAGRSAMQATSQLLVANACCRTIIQWERPGMLSHLSRPLVNI